MEIMEGKILVGVGRECWWWLVSRWCCWVCWGAVGVGFVHLGAGDGVVEMVGGDLRSRRRLSRYQYVFRYFSILTCRSWQKSWKESAWLSFTSLGRFEVLPPLARQTLKQRLHCRASGFNGRFFFLWFEPETLPHSLLSLDWPFPQRPLWFSKAELAVYVSMWIFSLPFCVAFTHYTSRFVSSLPFRPG